MTPRLFFLASIAWVALWWLITWSRIPILSEYSFFPLWLGYILLTNAVSEVWQGDSLMRRMSWNFVFLFAVSVPLWWLFEYLNGFLQDWQYIFPYPMSSLHYVIEASIDFSTVVPAVLSVTFLFERIFDERGVGKGWPLGVNRAWLALSAAAGIALLYLMTAFPQFLFPFAWIAPFLVFEPVLYVSGLPSLLRRIERGDWTLTLAVMSATLFTGVFWEMWNYCSLPKWLYTIPYIDFWKVFEMPLLGYGGYPFFGIIVMSFTLLALSLAGRRDLVRTAGWDA